MGRTVVRRVEQPRSHRVRDWLLMVVAAAILIFAVVGVVSAAGYLGGKVAASPTKNQPQVRKPVSDVAALQDVTRARAQATAIVKKARNAGRSILNSETKKARHQASVILAKARARSRARAAIVPAPTSAPPTSQAPASNTSTGNTGSSNTAAAGAGGTAASGAVSAGAATGSTGSTSSSSSATSIGSASGTAPSTVAPNLGSVPATWLVVAYGATFGRGPGNAGGVSVINRSKGPLSGLVRVNYIGKTGVIGSAIAPFTDLPGGQSAILPLNGMQYPGGTVRYQITMTNVH